MQRLEHTTTTNHNIIDHHQEHHDDNKNEVVVRPAQHPTSFSSNKNNDDGDSRSSSIDDIALDVIRKEAEALLALEESFLLSSKSHNDDEATGVQQQRQRGRSFGDAVGIIEERIHNSDNNSGGRGGGRVIVTGMGKSGHIGQKIAATLSSMGTPAFFVHPAEASHGDMGMISSSTDVVLALSKSGNTDEVRDLLAWSKKENVPIIAMTSNEQSAMGSAADSVLLIPSSVKEACPNNQAPTTSTTMMIAVGDALAVTLAKRMNFSQHDFRNLHPGGTLGKKQ